MAYTRHVKIQESHAYTEEFARRVIDSTDIVKLVAQFTPLEKQAGTNLYRGNCAFHADTSKSMVVYPDKKSFHCFDCGEGGNAATFLMKKKNMSFNQAITYLAKVNNIQLDVPGIKQKPNTVLKNDLYNVNAEAARFYQNKLKEQDGEVARNYIQKRQLTDETVQTFRLGYSPTKGNALYKYLKNKGFSDDVMLQAGLIKISETGPYDMFRGRLMFPIIDAQQRVIAFGGRVLDDEVKPKYLNSPESPIFNKSATLYGIHDMPKTKNPYKFVILCEGNVDVIALHQAGLRNAVATLGTAFTRTHTPIVEQYSDMMMLSFDGDAAGQKACARTIKAVADSNMKVRVMSMAPEKDPDDFLKKHGKNEYLDRIRRSVTDLDFQLKYSAQNYDMNDPAQRQEYLEKSVDMIMEAQGRDIEHAIERT